MAHRIAIVSTDGKTIHQHFGRAERFHIVGLSESGYEYVESRDASASCSGFQHDEASFERTYQAALYDCEAVVAGKIGYGASAFLTGKGLRAFEAPGMIDAVLTEMLEKQVRE
mgnify:CR=1 FL=1